MQARTEQSQPDMNHPAIVEEGRNESIVKHMKRWAPYVLTAIVVPGGIALALIMLWRRWSVARQVANLQAAAQSAARA